MIPWVLPASYNTIGDIMVVVGMLVVEIFLLLQLLPRHGPAVPLTRMVLGSTLLLGSSGLLMAIAAAALSPTLTNYTVVLLAFNGMMLVPIGLWFIMLILLQDRPADVRGWFWPTVIMLMAVSAELLMGVVFVVSDGTTPIDVSAVAAGSLLSAWFLWSMAGTMFALLLWVRLDRALSVPLLGLAGSAVVAPWVPVSPLFGLALMAAVMVATLLAIARGLSLRSGPGPLGRIGPAAAVVIAFLAMTTTGSAVALAPSDLLPQLAFGTVMLGTMGGELLVLVREGLRPSAGPAGAVAGSDGPSVPSAPASSGATE